MSSDHTYISNSRLRQLEREANRTYQAEQEAQQIRARAEQREHNIRSQYQANIDTLHSSITSLSQQHNTDMQRASQDFRNRIAQQATQLQQEMAQQRAQNQRDIHSLERRVGQEIGRINTDIDGINERLNNIAHAQANTREFAEATIVELEDWLSRIKEMHPEKFAPDDFEALTAQLAIARNDFQRQEYGPALAITQVRMTDAARLLARLTYLNTQFQEMLIRIREQANNLNERVSMFTDGKPSHEFDIDGEHYNLPYDINFWTNERFGELRNRLAAISNLLETAESNRDIDIVRLENIQTELNNFDGDNGQLALLDEIGRAEQFRSFAVGDMAIRVHNALNIQGWHLVNDGRIDSDDRKPYTLTYEDELGNQIALVVNPGDNPINTSVSVEVFACGEVNRGSVREQEIKDGVNYTIDSLNGDAVQVGRHEHRNDCQANTSPQEFIRNVANEHQMQREH